LGQALNPGRRRPKAAIEASHSLRGLRIAEVVKQDLVITDGKVDAYRTKIRVSFKYEGHDE
jgi:flavin-binding protein dodecin